MQQGDWDVHVLYRNPTLGWTVSIAVCNGYTDIRVNGRTPDDTASECLVGRSRDRPAPSASRYGARRREIRGTRRFPLSISRNRGHREHQWSSAYSPPPPPVPPSRPSLCAYNLIPGGAGEKTSGIPPPTTCSPKVLLDILRTLSFF